MKPQSSHLLALLVLVSMQAASQDAGEGEAGEIAETESRFLFINMLEFLGEFETEEGGWISPDILGNEAFADLDRDGGEQATTDAAAREQRALSASGDDD